MTTFALFRNEKLKQHGLKSRHTSLENTLIIVLRFPELKQMTTPKQILLCYDAGSTLWYKGMHSV